jgi:hypothetical protein
MITSKELAHKFDSRDSEQMGLVVYDSSSQRDSVKTELLRHAEVLARTDSGKVADSTVYFLDGKLSAHALMINRLQDLNNESIVFINALLIA